MDCAREFTSVIPDCPLNERHYEAAWKQFLGSGAGVIFLLEEDKPLTANYEPKVLGGIGGICHPDLLTGRLTAVELFWYVKPEHRKGIWPVRLLKAFEKWAALMRCHEVAMIHMECSMPERLKEFYQRRGYTLFETMYRKRITPTEKER